MSVRMPLIGAQFAVALLFITGCSPMFAAATKTTKLAKILNSARRPNLAA